MPGIRRNAVAAAAALAAAILAAAAAGTGNAASSTTPIDSRSDAGSFRCEIQAKAGGGLAAMVHANVPLTGTYSFRVVGRSGGGSSNINQGGPFAAAAKEDVMLGMVSLGAGSAYTATLTVTANGATVTCSEPKAL